jgi:hypothetical protein
MNRARFITLLASLLGFGSIAEAREAIILPNAGPGYAEMKAELSRRMEAFQQTGNRGPVQTYAREIVARGVERQGGFQRHFPQGFQLDVTKGNIGKTVLLTASDGQWSSRKGFVTEIKVLNAASRSRYFEIADTSRPLKTSLGNTEVDVNLRHRATGRTLRMEVKNVKVTGSNLQDLKTQIAKLGADARRTGARQVWVNNQAIPDRFREDFRRYARSKGVAVYDRVSTGPGKVAAGRARSLQSVLRLENRILTPAKISPVWMSQRAGRWAGRAGIGVTGALLAYDVYRWRTGSLSGRQLAARTATTAGGAVGGWGGAQAGAMAGAALGSFVPGVGTVVGGIAGGILGGFFGGAAGAWATESVVNRWAQPSPTVEKSRTADYIAFLQDHYVGA